MRKVVSNNPLVNENYRNDDLIYLENKDFLDVLIKVRNLLHNNYRLLTHPLSGNFLGDKNCYKTVILEKGEKLDIGSVELIEDAVLMTRNSMKNRDRRIFIEEVSLDLQMLDYEIIKKIL